MSSFLLFVKATFKGWMPIMYAAVDSRNVSLFWLSFYSCFNSIELKIMIMVYNQTLGMLPFISITAGRWSARVWGESVHVPLFCHLHHPWRFLHIKSLHWRHHWQLQSAEEKDKYIFTINLTTKPAALDVLKGFGLYKKKEYIYIYIYILCEQA